MPYFVYYGYKSPDNCDASEGSGPYKFVECETESEVTKLRKEHEEAISGNREFSHPIFRVIEGEELDIQPKKRVVSWELKKKK